MSSLIVHRDPNAVMRHIIDVRQHHLATDVSQGEGGEDSGPNPHDLYDAALGACKALTLRWYARRKGLPLDDVRVAVTRDSSGERQGTYRLATRITLLGDLTDAQRRELLGVAAKCPVHKLMSSATTEITTELDEPAP